MQKNKRQKRRMYLTVALILLAAISGLLLTSDGEVSASHALINSQGTNQQSSDASNNLFEDDSMAGPMVKMFSALAIVVIAVFMALYLLKRLMGKRYGGSTTLNSLEVMQSTHVGPNKIISLVRVGKRSVLVGVTDSQISTLTELDQIETEELMALPEVSPARPENFQGIFATATKKLKEMSSTRKQAALDIT